MRMRSLAAGLFLLGIAQAGAQTPPAPGQVPTAPGPVTAESLERGLVNIGLMAGHAWQCLPEADRPAAQARLLAFNSIVIAEMGANAAFRFATSFGAGSSHEVDRAFCERSRADLAALFARHNLNR
jgi:hypothetical protein